MAFPPPTSLENKLLRVFYTKNDSAQLTLARSRILIPVYPFVSFADDSAVASGSSSGSNPQARYATVALRACIDTLLLSCPDLLHDRHRDYTVYHFDPLESISEDPSAQSLAKNGISVGLGLISELKKDEKTVAITGTVMKMKTGGEGVEVVFQLREVPRQGPSNGVDYTDPNIAAAIDRYRAEQEAKLNSRRRRPKAPQGPFNKRLQPITAHCEAERLLAEAGAGNYGRRTKSETPATHAPSPDAYLTPATSTASTPSSSQQPPSSQSTVASPPASQTAGSNASQPDSATILAILSLIDSSPDAASKVENNPLLQLALQSLLQQHSNNTPPAAQTSSVVDTSQDDEVIVLDKENVNPSAFRRRAELEGAKLAEMSCPVPSTSTSTGTETTHNASHGLGLGARSNSVSSDVSQVRSQQNTAEEQSSSRNRSSSGSSRKGKEKAHQPNSNHSPRGYRLPIYAKPGGSTEPWSSPPRSRHSTFNENTQAGSSRAAPIVIPDSPLAPTVPASSPIRGKNHASRKPYVLPEWARTTTATQPRFSEEALKAMADAEKQREEDRKAKRAKWASRSKSTSALSSGPSSSSGSQVEPASSSSANAILPLPSTSGSGPSSSQPNLSMPVFAAPASSFPFVVPKTPPRKRPRSPSQSPLARSGNLFTPNGLFTPKRNRGGLDLGSPLFSPSPARSVRAGNSLLQSLQANKSDEDDDALSRELDSALDEMEMSVTSIPGTSSELADDSANNVEFVPASDADEYYPQKQIWPGLPPSSPPLPSSPMQSDEQLPPIETPYDEEPLATSDTEPEDDFLSPSRNDDDPTLSNSDMEDHTTMNSEGLQGLDQSDQQAAEDIAAFLSQFTNLSSDAPTGVDTADTADIWGQMFQDPSQTNTGQILGGEDANAFWNEQLKHIISGSSTSEPADTGGTCDWLPSGDTGGLDIGKVMADIKDLYSGTVM